MKTLTLMTAFVALSLNTAKAEEAKPVDPVEACKAKVLFLYNFEMMKIEKEQFAGRLGHTPANLQKQRQEMKKAGDLEACEELKED